MNILAKRLPAKTAITSDSIRAEIVRNESEVASLQAKLSRAEAAIATLDDAEHVKVIEASAATRRAIDRLNVARAHLELELPLCVAEEETQARAAVDDALRSRAAGAVKANNDTAAKLLRDYDRLANQMGDILQQLSDISAETAAVNAALRSNPVADSVASYNQIYRKTPDRQASDRRQMCYVWVYPDGTVERAALDSNGNPKQPDRKWIHHEQCYITANLEKREIVIGRTSFRPGPYADSLLEIHLPVGFINGTCHWPRG